MKKDALFCIGQKAFIEKDGKLLVLCPNDKHITKGPKALDFPGGKIQEGEAKVGDHGSLTESLKREVLEETGLTIEVGQPFFTWYWEFKKGSRNYPKVVYLVGFRCQYVSGDLKLSDEHVGYNWIDRENYQEFDEGTEYYTAILKYFNGNA